MTGVPDAARCHEILRKAGADARLVVHVDAVARAAVAIASRLATAGHKVDEGLVLAGSLLHDLGRTRTQGIDHATVGARMARDLGLPEPLALVIERHTGAGIDPDEAQGLGLPVKDYTPRTLEEKVVCHADNLIDGGRRQKVQEELDHLRSRGLDRVATKMLGLHRELSDLAGRDLDDVR